MSASPGSRIVVGISETGSMEPISWAAREAQLRELPLLLVHASRLADPAGRRASSARAERIEAEAHSVATNAGWYARQLLPGHPVETVVRPGRPAEALIQLAAGARLIVVGTDKGPHLDVVRGATGAQIAAHAGVPVLVVRGDREVTGPGDRRVIAGLSRGAESEAVLEAAFLEADLRQTGVLVVHAFGADTAHGPVPENDPLVGELSAVWQRKYPHVPVELRLTPSSASEALLAASQGAELLVIGDRGPGGFAGLRLGSVCSAALHHAACPVLVVPTTVERGQR